MKALFLANSYHLNTTKSADFFIEFLKSKYASVDIVPHKEAYSVLPNSQYDKVFVWQRLWNPVALDSFDPQKIVLIPMYDDCPKDRQFWEAYRGFKILCFSSTLFTFLKKEGHAVFSIQYWPKPITDFKLDYSRPKAFFWQRHSQLQWTDLLNCISPEQLMSFHLHGNMIQAGTREPSELEIERYKITRSNWFDSPAQLVATLRAFNIYFAPRLFEGIGQSFLEAMALGMCVVAPNHPTMNEYIRNGENGLLWDSIPERIDLKDFERIGKAAQVSVAVGHQRWIESLEELFAFFHSDSPSRRKKRLVLGSVLYGKTEFALRRLYRIWKRIVHVK